MRCYSFCLGHSIELSGLYRQLKLQCYCVVQLGDALKVKLNPEQDAEIYIFSMGTVVTWQLNRHELTAIFAMIQGYVDQPVSQLVSDYFSFSYGTETKMQPHDYFNVDKLVLDQRSSEIRLSVAYGLSHSVKLEMYDHMIQRLIDQHGGLVNQLAAKGRIKLSRRRINQVLGQIFVVRSLINLKGEYLSLPKYFWQNCSDEADYRVVIDYMDINDRVAALNQKMDVLGEMFEMLKSQLEHVHFFILEIVIIILIGVEIIVSLPHFANLWF